MSTFLRRQPNGTYVATVEVYVRENGSDTVHTNIVYVIDDEPHTRLQVEDEAMNVMVDQVEGEDAWGVVVGACVRHDVDGSEREGANA